MSTAYLLHYQNKSGLSVCLSLNGCQQENFGLLDRATAGRGFVRIGSGSGFFRRVAEELTYVSCRRRIRRIVTAWLMMTISSSRRPVNGMEWISPPYCLVSLRTVWWSIWGAVQMWVPKFTGFTEEIWLAQARS
jgi:hypothetical protein